KDPLVISRKLLERLSHIGHGRRLVLIGNSTRAVAANCVSNSRFNASARRPALERVPPRMIGTDRLVRYAKPAHPLRQTFSCLYRSGPRRVRRVAVCFLGKLLVVVEQRSIAFRLHKIDEALFDQMLMQRDRSWLARFHRASLRRDLYYPKSLPFNY